MDLGTALFEASLRLDILKKEALNPFCESMISALVAGVRFIPSM
jgi:hypothetical protein